MDACVHASVRIEVYYGRPHQQLVQQLVHLLLCVVELALAVGDLALCLQHRIGCNLRMQGWAKKG